MRVPPPEATSAVRSASATSAMVLRSTFPPSARGTGARRAAGLLTRGSLLRRLPGPRASGTSAEEHLPSQRRDRPGLAPASLDRSPVSCCQTLPLGYAGMRDGDGPDLASWLPVRRLGGCRSSPSPRSPISAPASAAGISSCASSRTPPSSRVLGALLLYRALRQPWLALAVGSVYAVIGRGAPVVRPADATPRPVDWAIDTAGAAIGVLLYALWRQRR